MANNESASSVEQQVDVSEAKKDEKKNVRVAERAVDRAFSTGKADRAFITRQAQLDAAEAVAMAGIAMESDEAADEVERLAVIAGSMGNRERARTAREKAREARNRAKEDHRAATKSAKKAYDAIRFSDPTKLGFLRVVQVVFLVHIVLTLLVLLLTSRDDITYNYITIVEWVMTVLESIAFYFFVNRYKLGRPLVIGMATFGLVSSSVSYIITQQATLTTILSNTSYYLFLLLYFIFSDRVKATLVNDLAHDKGAMEDDEFVIDRRSWPFYRNLIIYFVIFSVLGHWMEAAFCQLIRLGIVQGEFDPNNTMLWRDWFYPYPMHGTAVCLMALILYPAFELMKKKFKNRYMPYVISFIMNMATCTLIEFCGGLMFNANLQNWDYSNMPFNFMGQICLQNAIGFGVAASVISWWVYPMMERAIARVRPAIMNIVCVIVAIAGGILFSLYAISPPEGISISDGERTVTTIEETRERSNLYTDTIEIESLVDSVNQRLNTPQAIPQDDLNEIKQHYETVDKELDAVKERLESPSSKAA